MDALCQSGTREFGPSEVLYQAANSRPGLSGPSIGGGGAATPAQLDCSMADPSELQAIMSLSGISGRHVKAARAMLGWTLNDFARISGISNVTLSHLETGESKGSLPIPNGPSCPLS